VLNRRPTVYVRDANLDYVAQLDFFDSLKWVDAYNFKDSPGGFELTINADDLATTWLRDTGSGIVILDGDSVMFSGYTTKIERQQNSDRSQYIFTGQDDSGLLAQRLAHPQPGSTAPPYSTTEYDTRTGVCSTILRQYVDVNLGASAVTSRKDTRVTLGADPAVGTTVTGNARWQQLSVLLNELATISGGVGYKIRQSGSNLEFQTFAPTDLTDTIIFSVGNGTLATFSYTVESGAGNYVFAGGQNEGTSRTIAEGYDGDSVTRWGRREIFRDARDDSTAALLAASITDELENSSDKASVTFQPIDIGQQQYWTDYQTGDLVTVVIDGVAFQNPVISVECTLNNDGLTVVPTVATPNNFDTLKMTDQIALHNRRIRNLERR